MDVSEWQGKINWQEASKDIDFTFIRISHSTKHLDYMYDYNMTEAEAAEFPSELMYTVLQLPMHRHWQKHSWLFVKCRGTRFPTR